MNIIPMVSRNYFLAFTFIFIICNNPIFSQCCFKIQTTKSCQTANNGKAVIIPCIQGNYTYQWNDPAVQSGAEASNLAPGIYKVMISYNGTDCPLQEIIIIDSTCNDYIIPNIITPNGDGINDVFMIKGLEPGVKLTVVNRWGNSVYSSKSYMNDWDASELTNGTYFYELVIPSHENTSQNKNNTLLKGFIQLIR